MKKIALMLALAIIALAGAANAAVVTKSSDISTSETWTALPAGDYYQLADTIYVLPGATLTIEAGVVVKSDNVGSLGVCRGAKIYVNGTKDAPVIMTSLDDNLSTWHEGAEEWGSLAICGNGLISASHYGDGTKEPYEQVRDNSKTPGLDSDGLPEYDDQNNEIGTAYNEKSMEGLTHATRSLYGGIDDNDDSGSISYLSLRYGGRVVGFADELNGLSLGAVGQETDIDYIDIMNNVDDGIEIWGGKVCLKHVNIWNVGDDSFDVDEGWRGKAQFGLIVQGYSTEAKQGSGIGDNCFETDGAEAQDAQPVTTASIYNFTVVGNPICGDGATAWRDNARVQYRQCIFMNIGEELVRKDDSDGDGGKGYDYNDNTLSWAQTWTTDATYAVTGAMEAQTWTYTAGAYNDPAVMYTSQDPAGKLAEIKDCVMYANAYDSGDKAVEVGVLAADYTGLNDNVVAGEAPITALERGLPVKLEADKTYYVQPVTFIDPRAANDALVSATTAPAGDAFLTQVNYRGGFDANENWIEGWTAAASFGMTTKISNADLNNDNKVNISDFAEFSADWMMGM